MTTNQKKLAQQCLAFNAAVTHGSTKVKFTKDNGREVITTTTCPAWQLDDGTPVVMLKGIKEYCELERVEVAG